MTSPSFRALAVAAHPDDIEFSCGATLARWAQEGAEVTLCVVTDGATGTQDQDMIGKGLSEVRRQEARAAADALGAARIDFLGYPDGYVEYSLDLRRDIARVFRRYRPHRFVVMDPAPLPGGWFVNHPDHRAIGQASLDVVPTAGTTPGHFPELLEEGLAPWRGLRELWIAGPAGGEAVVDVSTTVQRKIDALLCHRSQVGDDADAIAGWVRQRLAEIGKRAGYDYAESFQVLSRGPGFHEDEQEELDVDVARAELDPRSAPAGTTE
ncbi:MAG TPA: PIG-L deacetylase family protein [Actinomycetota bacterium]|jgi:LmbE family N-acetylglucosaminyl deacetylase|nr:PIG-L deacetylase family protein [Actinomycetota bacterium]